MEKILSEIIVEKINERLNITPSVLLYDELVGIVESEILGNKAHFGDPCIYCGINWDKVVTGDCPSR